MHYVIIGLGLTGFSVAKYLSATKKCKISIIDSRIEPPYLARLIEKFPKIAIYIDGFHPEIQRQADYIVLSPGVSSDFIVKNVEIINDLELFAQEKKSKTPVVAITGSNGKSTVATLTAKILEASGLQVGLGGNIGIPALDLLEKECDIYVLELSSFQLEHLKSLNNHIAVLLNLAADHLDRYDNNIQKYFLTKHRIFNDCKHALINGLDKNIIAPKNSIDFSATGNLPINFSAMLAIANILNIKQDVALKVIANFKGLEHRQELVLEQNNICWVNDSKATNVAATIMALNVFSNNIILIAGGSAKGEDLSLLKPVILKTCKNIILIGATGNELFDLLEKGIACTKVISLESAVQLAHRVAVAGDTVLLSPAAASFDMFANFAARGKNFKNLV